MDGDSYLQILTEIGANNHGGDGIGVVESWHRTLQAAKDVAGWYQKGKKWEDADVRDLMEQASYEIDRTTGTMEEVISKESMALINSARMGKGLTPINLGGLVRQPLDPLHGVNEEVVSDTCRA